MIDDLDARLRAANPSSVRRGDPVSESGLELLASLKSGAPEENVIPMVRKRRTLTPLAGAAAAAVTLVAVVVALSGGPGSQFAHDSGGMPEAASMAAPVVLPLTFDDASGMAEADGAEGTEELLSGLASLAGESARVSGVRQSSWDLSFEAYDGGAGQSTSSDSGRGVELHSSDGFGDQGGDASGEEVEESAESGVDDTDAWERSDEGSIETFSQDSMGPMMDEPGTDYSTGSGMGWVPVSTEVSDLPTDPSGVGEFLREYGGLGRSDLPSYLVTIRWLMLDYTLTPEQDSALLEFLAGQQGLESRGYTVDRGGRDAYAFSALDGAPVNLEYQLLVSPETGRILSMETVYVGPPAGDLASPAVLEYTLWDR